MLQYYKYIINPKEKQKEAQNMEEAKTIAGVERERERESHNINK